MAAMRDRHAVTGSQSAKIMPLHRASKTFAYTDTDDVDVLAGEKMRRSEFRADWQYGILGNPKFGKPRLRLDPGLREMTTLRLCHALDLSRADAKLQS